MVVVNFSAHRLREHQRVQLEALLSESVTEEIDASVTFDDSRLESQVDELFKRLGLTAEDWLEKVIYLPNYAPAAAIIVAKLHGLTGHFPTILRMGEEERAGVTRYGVMELINLQTIRKRGRACRGGY